MSRIHLLSETLASQVAAGEVIERPASVVKELVENSIDARAQKIEIQIRRGGISLIRVNDDGIGMDRDDALLCLERHATSKIRSSADLAAIGTLGFRGEALPSIASVSRFRLTTREHDAVAGTDIIVSGGRMETVREGGEAPGTQVEVRSIFFNLPARRKFLIRKTLKHETSSTSSIFKRSVIRRLRSRFSVTTGSCFNFQRRKHCANASAIFAAANYSIDCSKLMRDRAVPRSNSAALSARPE